MSFHQTIDIDAPALGQGATCQPLLAALPQWFGGGALLGVCAAQIDELPTLIASVQKQAHGFLSFQRHNTYAAEIMLLGVQPSAQQVGIGKALLRRLERDLYQHEVEFIHLFLPTPDQQDALFTHPRRFFFAQGYRPMLESPERLAKGRPAMLMAKKVKGGLGAMF